jgi:hypothetical protein
VNTGYVLWFAALVVAAGAALLWLAIGSVPEIPPDPAPETGPEPDIAPSPASAREPVSALEPATIPEPESEPEPASEPAAQDRIARPS